MENNEIKSVGDFLKIVKKLYPNDEQAFFRGQSSSKYEVNSSFCRLVRYNKMVADSAIPYQLANKLCREFKNNMPIYSENNLIKDYTLNDIDLMMVAQHYGLATRLIDWTKNPLVALYFATEEVKQENDCSVYMMYHVEDSHPIAKVSSHAFVANLKKEQRRFMGCLKLIQQAILKNSFNTIDIDLLKKYDEHFAEDIVYPPFQINEKLSSSDLHSYINRMSINPFSHNVLSMNLDAFLQKNSVNYICPLYSVEFFNDVTYIIEPLPLNHRIKNQQGVFVFSNSLTNDVILNSKLSSENIVRYINVEPDIKDKESGVFRIDISREYIAEIKKELNLYGVSKEFIYPELPSYTKIMQERVVSEIKRGKI